MDQETMRTVLKGVGPVVGFLIWMANGWGGKGFFLGLVAGFLATLVTAVLLGAFATH